MDNTTLSKLEYIDESLSALPFSQERGLLYGDGFFSTIKVVNGKPHRWALHLERISFSAQKLEFFELDVSWIYLKIVNLIEKESLRDGILRMTITRGENPVEHRGYAIPQKPSYRLYLSASHKNLEDTKVNFKDGVSLGLSKVPISCNKRLAGVKHLNRLDQVLASSKLKAGCFDDLMFNGKRMISGTKTNVYFYVNGFWLTPKVNKAGVNGTVRRWLLDTQPDVRESQFGLEILKRAEYCLVSNAIIGIIPVTSIQLGAKKHRFEAYPNLKKLQQEYEEV